jgi:hypothetical protein
MDKIKILVVTSFNETYNEIGSFAAKYWSEYCIRHGYDFLCSKQDWCPDERPFAWGKVQLIRSLLETKYNWIVWVRGAY